MPDGIDTEETCPEWCFGHKIRAMVIIPRAPGPGRVASGVILLLPRPDQDPATLSSIRYGKAIRLDSRDGENYRVLRGLHDHLSETGQ